MAYTTETKMATTPAAWGVILQFGIATSQAPTQALQTASRTPHPILKVALRLITVTVLTFSQWLNRADCCGEVCNSCWEHSTKLLPSRESIGTPYIDGRRHRFRPPPSSPGKDRSAPPSTRAGPGALAVPGSRRMVL